MSIVATATFLVPPRGIYMYLVGGQDPFKAIHFMDILPNYPKIIGAVPTSPETRRGIVVCHTANHVFRWVNATSQRP